MNPDYILLSGIKNPEIVCAHFDSHMVDVAYAEKESSSTVKLHVEDDVDLRAQATYEWLEGVTREALATIGEAEARFELARVYARRK
jgi:hypothetical protein